MRIMRITQRTSVQLIHLCMNAFLLSICFLLLAKRKISDIRDSPSVLRVE